MEIKINIDRLEKRLDGLAKEQIPFAVAGAINSTVIQIRDAQQKEMMKVFDRPTPFTLKGVLYTKATKAKLSASVFISTRQNHLSNAEGDSASREYLLPQIRGGPRPPKASEKMFPTWILPSGLYVSPAHRVKDQYGNIPGSKMVKLLSAMSTFSEEGYKMNRTAASIRRKLKKGIKMNDYFVKHHASGHPIGIFERTGGSKAQGLPVLFFIGKPSYKKRYDFVGTGAMVVRKNWKDNITRAIQWAISTKK